MLHTMLSIIYLCPNSFRNTVDIITINRRLELGPTLVTTAENYPINGVVTTPTLTSSTASDVLSVLKTCRTLEQYS